MMKKIMNLFLIVFVIFVLAGCSNNNTNNTENLESKKNSYTQISMEEAVKMMEEESDYIILDVRRPDEFAEKHIPNAINVPNETIGKDEIPELPNKEQLILV